LILSAAERLRRTGNCIATTPNITLKKNIKNNKNNKNILKSSIAKKRF
jgi:hypothetical protein